MSLKRRQTQLTRRERQIMDALYRLGRATAAEILELMPGAPGYSTVRTQLRVLEQKGHVRHEEQGLRYIYSPTVPRHAARKSALKNLVDTFFEGSTAKAVAARPASTATLRPVRTWSSIRGTITRSGFRAPLSP